MPCYRAVTSARLHTSGIELHFAPFSSGATRRDATRFFPEFRDPERRAVARDNGETRGWIDRSSVGRG